MKTLKKSKFPNLTYTNQLNTTVQMRGRFLNESEDL